MIVQEARAASNALYDESSKCFRNANAAYRDGDYRLSDDLTAKVGSHCHDILRNETIVWQYRPESNLYMILI